jgi:hypothetical protein
MKTETIDWNAWEIEEPSSGFADRVMEAARAETRTSVLVPHRRRAVRWMGAVAVAALAAGSLTALAMWGVARLSPQPQPPAPASGHPAAKPTVLAAPSQAPASAADRDTRHARSTVVDRKLRDTVRARLVVALEANGVERDPHTGLTIPVGTPGPKHNLSREYLQARIREDFYPMAKVCYEEALAKQPNLAGRVVVDFMIVGDTKVGGIVDQAKINERTTIADPKMTDCLRESMLSMVFAPPEDDGWMTVTYPFVFLPDADDGRE